MKKDTEDFLKLTEKGQKHLMAACRKMEEDGCDIATTMVIFIAHTAVLLEGVSLCCGKPLQEVYDDYIRHLYDCFDKVNDREK